MEALLTGLALAGLSGLTVLAFQNTHGFARLFPYLLVAASVVFIGLAIWYVAVVYTWSLVGEFVKKEDLETAETVVAGIRTPSAWIGVGNLAFVVYLLLMLWLPTFLKEAGESKDG